MSAQNPAAGQPPVADVYDVVTEIRTLARRAKAGTVCRSAALDNIAFLADYLQTLPLYDVDVSTLKPDLAALWSQASQRLDQIRRNTVASTPATVIAQRRCCPCSSSGVPGRQQIG